MIEVYAVGIGPGSTDYLTPQAAAVLRKCTVIAGYKLYLEQIPEFTRGKRLIPGTMRQEVMRCREALDAALAGETVAVISSGDAGVYGMAGLLLELTEFERYREIRITVIPGLTAALAAAALVGAPLMNDFAVLSLSDLMTPKDLIEKRLRLLAETDFVVALYNPASSKRRELLDYAIRVFRAAGGPLPCALCRNVGREAEQFELFTLDTLPREQVQMTSLVIIGNSRTVIRNNRLYCPRGYREKYELEG